MNDQLLSTLTALREGFIAKLPGRLVVLQALLDKVKRGKSGALAELHRAAHSLVGTAGTYRLMQVSEAARELENIASFLQEPVNEVDQHALDTAYAGLASCAARSALNLVSAQLKRTVSARVMVVEDDPEQAEWLRSVLEEAGYRVGMYSELESFRAALQEADLPAAVIMDMVFPEGDEAGAQIIAQMKQHSLKVVPVIFLSVRQDMAAKLAAHRAGATRYLTKPVEREALLRVIADSAALAPDTPYRVLVVDDSKSQLAVHSHMLRQADMEVCESGNPLEVLNILENFPAELLLLDMHMPECSGPELAAILHDDERYSGIPIVYLSTETDVSRQLLALDRGGDHFLSKPVNPMHLVSVVCLHARRFRQSKEQAEAMRAMRYEQERHQQALDAHAIVSVTDVSGNIQYVNDKFCAISGYAREELLGKNQRVVKSSVHPGEYFDAMWEAISSGKIWQGEICNRTKSGSLYWVQTSIVPFLDKSGLPYQYISIRTDITHLKGIEQALLVSKEAAESASRAKSEFLASMSHELRTPLNAILGFSQLFTMDARIPQDARENAREIERAGQHLLSLINDMIDLARIEAGKLGFSVEPVSMESVLKGSFSMVESFARERGIRLLVNGATGQDITVQADHLRLRQVLINLLTNAVKYNKPQGTVNLSCNLGEGKVRISVTDTGYGIPVELHGRIFNAFDRLGEERGDIEGTGIGLVITKRIVEAMGGTIGFESIVGQGSTFWVEMPLAIEGENHSLEQADDAVIQHATAQSDRPIVLYVEDNPMNVRLMQQIFAGRKNLELCLAGSAEEGMERANQLHPSLILMDINLPGMDGYKALELLKADEYTRHIPVVAITANAMKGDEERCLSSGFSAYQAKPLNISGFLMMLDQYIQSGSARG